MYVGLYDWLSPPSNNPNECCQCWSLKCKKLTLLVILFAFISTFAIVSLLLWTFFGFALPNVIIAVVTVLQFFTLLICVPAFFDDTKYRYMLPSLWVNIIALILWVLLLVIYAVKLILHHVNNTNSIHNNASLVFFPFIPIIDERGAQLTSYEKDLNYLGYTFFLFMSELFLLYVFYGVYDIFRSKNTVQSKARHIPGRRTIPHNVCYLEQNIDEIYDTRAEKFRKAGN